MPSRRIISVLTAVFVTAVLAGAAALRRGNARSGDAVSPRTDYGRRHPAARTETATFAAGCFWKLEHAMRRVDGVVSTTAGYTGGDAAGATHAAVSAGRTGHTEAVRVEFDPSAVSYDRLLEVFWASHDPTQFALEAGEPAPPGRSVIYYHTDAQRAAAEASKARVRSSDRYAGAPLPTEILPAGAFFRAEAEHQQYLDRNGSAASCAAR